jgi:hypothetical protein
VDKQNVEYPWNEKCYYTKTRIKALTHATAWRNPEERMSVSLCHGPSHIQVRAVLILSFMHWLGVRGAPHTESKCWLCMGLSQSHVLFKDSILCWVVSLRHCTVPRIQSMLKAYLLIQMEPNLGFIHLPPVITQRAGKPVLTTWSGQVINWLWSLVLSPIN